MPDPTTPVTERPPGPRYEPRCPGCGYSLHGLCTHESPDGACPECGKRYDLYDTGRAWPTPGLARPTLMTVLIVLMLVLPVGIVFSPIAMSIVLGVLDQAHNNRTINDLLTLLVLLTPFTVTAGAGLMLGWLYRLCQAVCVEKVYRRRRGIILPGLLFAGVELCLAFVYFCGGCLWLLSQLDLSNMH